MSVGVSDESIFPQYLEYLQLRTTQPTGQNNPKVTVIYILSSVLKYLTVCLGGFKIIPLRGFFFSNFIINSNAWYQRQWH